MALMLSTIISQPCRLVLVSQAPTTEDAYGNKIPGTAPETDALCSVQQVTRDEPEDHGEMSVTGWRLFFPAGTSIDTADRVKVGYEELDGFPDSDLFPGADTLPTAGSGAIVTFELTGSPWHVHDPWRNRESHVEASAKVAQ